MIPDTEIEYPVNYVLDGQQRISTIYAVFSDKAEQEASTAQYNPNLNIFEIFYDFFDKRFKPASDIDLKCDSILSLKVLIDTAKLVPALIILNPIYHTEASDLW